MMAYLNKLFVSNGPLLHMKCINQNFITSFYAPNKEKLFKAIHEFI